MTSRPSLSEFRAAPSAVTDESPTRGPSGSQPEGRARPEGGAFMGTWGLACSGTVVGGKHRLAVPGRPPRARRREALRLLGCKSVRHRNEKSR
jgi:hypothetical protein